MKLKLLFTQVFVTIFSCLYAQSPSDFIHFDGNRILKGEEEIKPKMLNYGLYFVKDLNSGNYFLSPHLSNHTNWQPTPSFNELIADLDHIESLGVNVLRTYIYGYDGVSPGAIETFVDSNGQLQIAGESYATYISLLNQFLSLCEARDISVILVLGKAHQEYSQHADKHLLSGKYSKVWREHLTNVGLAMKNNTNIFAYDLYNEISDEYFLHNEFDQLLISNWVSDWYFTLKSAAPNQLATVGVQKPNSSFVTDPEMMVVDFVNYHFYAHAKDPDNINQTIENLSGSIYWASKTDKGRWFIGETGFSGTDSTASQKHGTSNNDYIGTEAEQAQFVTSVYQNALDCNCKGTALWQYHDVLVNEDTSISKRDSNPDLQHNYYGIVHYGNGIREKRATVALRNFNGFPNPLNCIKPVNYYNINGKTSHTVRGTVQDKFGNPIENAVALSIGDAYTFTDNQGNFELKTDSPTTRLYISANGYEVYRKYNPPSVLNSIITLAKTEHNQWQKTWSNSRNKDVNGLIRIDDKLTEQNFIHLVGDFNGDSTDELLQFDPTNYSDIHLFDYNPIASQSNTIYDFYQTIWTGQAGNNLYNFISSGTFSSGSVDHYVGDFDGDGSDELFLIKPNRMAVFSYNGTTWVRDWGAQNSNVHMHQYANRLSVGDFNGDGKDDILGHPSTGWMTIFEFDNNAGWVWGYWTNLGNNYPIVNYRNNLRVGDFDGDGQDDILGIDNGVAMELFTYSPNAQTGFTSMWFTNNPNHMMVAFGSRFVIGNFDTDPQDELLGYGGWATKFDFDNSDFHWGWSTLTDTRIVDYNTHPHNSNDELFFFKTYPNNPENLFVKSSGVFHMYMMNNLIYNEHSLIKAKRSVASSNPTEKVKEEYELKIYPNPATDNLKVEGDLEKFDKIKILTLSGREVLGLNLKKESSVEINISSLAKGMYFVLIEGTAMSTTKRITIY
jgi:hypothetical protein